MIIILDKQTIPYLPCLIITLEKSDFVDGVGHRFIRDLRLELNSETYLTEEVKTIYGKQLVWIIDIAGLETFITTYKKHFKEKYNNQLIKVYE